MKTRIFLFLLIFSLGATSASAQLTTGKPSSKVIRTGNRAQGGDFGIYVGATSTMFKNMFDNNVDMKALPLINFKYMVSSQFETRLGFEWYKSSERIKGDIISQNDAGENTTTASRDITSESSAMFYPGIAYHFSKKNLLDVYVGAELPLGWSSDRTISEVSNNYDARTKTSFVIGLGAFIGLQAYIAYLPLAIGVEYGISSRFDTGLKYKNESTIDGQTQITYEPDFESLKKLQGIAGTTQDYDNLKARKGEIGSQFRLTLTYYFK